MAQPGVWVVVDEDGRGDAVRQAIGAQAPLLAVQDPFSARRALGKEAVAGVVVCVGKRTLSLRSLCAHVRREFPRLPLIAVRDPRCADDPALLACVTDVIDDGSAADVTTNLARVSDAFEAGETTAILPPRPAPTRTPEARPRPAEPLEPVVVVGQPIVVPVVATRVPVAPLPRPIVMPAPPRPIVPTVAPVALLDPLGSPTPGSTSGEDGDRGDGDDVEATESTLITGGPNLSQVETTETHVGLSVGSSMESEEAREPIDGSGAEILMRVAAARRTGRLLIVDGEGAGTLHWSAGAPVGAELPTGDGGLYRRLVSSGLLAPTTAPPIVRQGRLLVALVESGQLAEATRLDFERGVLRDQVLALSRQGLVRAVFVSTRIPTRSTTTTTTTAAINVFGLILEARRRSVAPEVIAALADEIASWRITGTALLAEAAHLVAPFAGGRDIANLASDTTARQLTLALDWDRSMGTLLLLALRDAGLITATTTAPPAAGTTTTTTTTTTAPRHTGPMGVSPRQLLGVGMAPEEDDIEAAYSTHVARIDADLGRTTSSAERDALMALRERYDVARQALRLQLGFATSTGTNPF